MNIKPAFAVLLVCVLTISISRPERASAQQTTPTASDSVITRIAFGSCAVQDRPQPIWDAVNTWNPEIFIMAGDNIYGDTEDMDTLRAKYQKLEQKPGFREMREQATLLATWDDHDYGANDTGNWYPKKKESEQIFLDFFNVPEDSPRRSRPGVYGSRMFGPKDKRIQVILLDTRYFRDRFGKRSLNEMQKKLGYGPYVSNTDSSATMLGESQWQWLERQLKKPAELRLIVSSIQVISAEHGWEIWSQLPHEKQRLYQLIEKTNASGVLFLSGDVHWGEISRYEGNTYPLYDFTSSGLNQRWIKALNLPNHQRVGTTVYPYPNFGAITVNWQKRDPRVTMTLKDVNGANVVRHQIRLSEISY